MTASQEHYGVYTAVGRQERELPQGEYKKYPISPIRPDGRIHYYPEPDDVPREMAKLIDETTSEAFERAHPVVQASYIHYAFVVIHPFADGNGRVSRALAGVFLLRKPGIPFVMFNDQRDTYLKALEEANRGNYRPFIDFVEQRTIDALHLALEQFATPQPTNPIEQLQQLGITPQAVDGQRLMDAVFTEVEKNVKALPKVPQLHFLVTRPLGTQMIITSLGDKPRAMLAGSSTLEIGTQLRIVNKVMPNSYEPFRDLVLERRNVYPVIDEVTRRRIALWAKGLVEHFVAAALARYTVSE